MIERFINNGAIDTRLVHCAAGAAAALGVVNIGRFAARRLTFSTTSETLWLQGKLGPVLFAGLVCVVTAAVAEVLARLGTSQGRWPATAALGLTLIALVVASGAEIRYRQSLAPWPAFHRELKAFDPHVDAHETALVDGGGGSRPRARPSSFRVFRITNTADACASLRTEFERWANDGPVSSLDEVHSRAQGLQCRFSGVRAGLRVELAVANSQTTLSTLHRAQGQIEHGSDPAAVLMITDLRVE